MSAPRRFVFTIALTLVTGCGREPDSVPGAAVRQTSNAGSLTVGLSIDRDRITTADHVTLNLDVESDSAPAASLPPAGGELGGFMVVDRLTGEPRLLPDGRLHTTITCTLEPFLPGEYVLPAIEVGEADAAGERRPAATEPVTIIVDSVLAEGEESLTDIGPARGVIDPGPGRAVPWVIAVVVVGGGAFALATGLAVRRWSARHSVGVEDPCRTAERRLSAHGHGAEPDGEEIAAILRACIASRVEPRSLSMTTDELLASAAVRGAFTESELADLRAVLTGSDRARFGALGPAASAVRDWAGLALTLVRGMASRPPAPLAPGEGHGG